MSNLTEFKKSKDIKCHVACLDENYDQIEYNGARCYNVNIPNIGPVKAVYYDIKSLDLVYYYIKNNSISNATSRICPFMKFYKYKFIQASRHTHISKS
ncbi:DUF1972 domain-containing protein [Bacillus sp. ISL-40]|nr:DUF1972 domain-containing protein [Bacillus sp. ISL-40]MBT2739331.1 DUF1972 domain-containing protein [Bacillus sp. ISL-77]